jgi:hypothetical protein
LARRCRREASTPSPMLAVYEAAHRRQLRADSGHSRDRDRAARFDPSRSLSFAFGTALPAPKPTLGYRNDLPGMLLLHGRGDGFARVDGPEMVHSATMFAIAGDREDTLCLIRLRGVRLRASSATSSIEVILPKQSG